MVDINSSNVVDDNTVHAADAADGTFCRIYLLLLVLIIVVAAVTRGRKRKSVYVEDSGSNEEFDIENPPLNNDTENTNSNTNKRSSSKKNYQRGRGGTLGGNACNLTDNGPGGVNHLYASSSASDDNRDYFQGTGFQTSSKKKITEENVRAMVHNEKAVLQLFKLEGNMPITCSIDDSPEYKAMCGIIFSLLQSGDIESLDAGSTSSTSPKFNRSSLNIHGVHVKILDKFPSGYSCLREERS
mmetsp:Transcript_13035/g.26439  ORF Transcript_13035/g.26439 Transcript_13035/m.26439 type:complete len:242 (+) Transcript_13035:715-1440(+)